MFDGWRVNRKAVRKAAPKSIKPTAIATTINLPLFGVPEKNSIAAKVKASPASRIFVMGCFC